MKINSAGLQIIKESEGLKLKAYKAVPSEKYYTIGYGHYGPDVRPQMIVSKFLAEALLKNDVKKFEDIVTRKCSHLNLNENEFSALVSFTYNVGGANLSRLIKDRDKPTISAKMLEYNKAGGKVLKGLKIRRKKEHDLFLTEV